MVERGFSVRLPDILIYGRYEEHTRNDITTEKQHSISTPERLKRRGAWSLSSDCVTKSNRAWAYSGPGVWI